MKRKGIRQVEWFAIALGFFIGAGSASAIELPIPQLPPETDIIYLPDSGEPNPESTDYITIAKSIDDAPYELNGVVTKTQEVDISGKTIVIEAQHPNGLYEMLHNNLITRRLNIYAETVRINSQLHLPATNIYIKARTVKAGPSGAIITKPDYLASQNTERLFKPSNSEDGYGLPGHDGATGGTITIFAEFVEPFHMDLSGADGARGGPGTKGEDGEPRSPANTLLGGYQNVSEYVRSHTIKVYGTAVGDCDIFRNCDLRDESSGSDSPLRPAGDAKSAGRAGRGGHSGDLVISSNLHSNEFTNYVALRGGNNAPDQPPPKGGAAPTPNPWYVLNKNQYDQWRILKGPVYTSRGRDAAIPTQGYFGANGSISNNDKTYHAWLTPNLLRAVLRHAKDAYRHSRNAAATKATILSYLNKLNEYQVSDEWERIEIISGFFGPVEVDRSHLTKIEKAEVAQIQTEMATLLYRINSGLDYFGNPPGWVPMLSFEAWQSLYAKEVESAMGILYLNYWLQAKGDNLKAKKEALAKLRIKLLADIDFARTETSRFQSLLDTDLRTRMGQIEFDIPDMLGELKAMEESIRRQAEYQKESAAKQATLFRNVRIVATVLKAVPYPACTAVGMGLDAVAGIAEKSNPDDAWSTIQQLPSVAEAYNKGYGSPETAVKRQQWDAAIDRAKQSAANINFNDPATIPSNVKGMQEAIGQASALLKPISDVSKLAQPIRVSSEEVDAATAKLKAENPGYQELTNKIRAKIADKQQLADQINQASMALNDLQNRISKDILQVNQYNGELENVTQALSIETLQYVSSLEADARERLERFQYYLAKAFQYRMVKPYPVNTNVASVIDKIKRMVAAADSTSELTAAQFSSLKSLYDQELGAVADTILANIDLSEIQPDTTFTLNADQLRRLNGRERVKLNLMRWDNPQDGFYQSEENIRIANIEIIGKTSNPNRFRLTLEHSGISLIEKNGTTYQFNHFSKTPNQNYHFWQAESINGNFRQIQKSQGTESLLRSLMKPGTPEAKVQLFSSPAAWADFELSSEAFNASMSNLQLSQVVLKVTYTSQQRSNSFPALHILAKDGVENRLAPVFNVDQRDLHNRQAGISMVSRYYRDLSKINVEAPKIYGNLVFHSWQSRSGSIISNSNKLLVSTTSPFESIVAKYVLNSSFDYDGDGIPDSWETKYGLNKNDFLDGAQDPDKDGKSNYQEYLAGTDPTKAGSVSVISVTKAGGGTVISRPSGINCGADCSESYGGTSNVTLTAIPDPGYLFLGWAGACQGTVAVCTITPNANKAVRAEFAINYPVIKGWRYHP